MKSLSDRVGVARLGVAFESACGGRSSRSSSSTVPSSRLLDHAGQRDQVAWLEREDREPQHRVAEQIGGDDALRELVERRRSGSRRACRPGCSCSGSRRCRCMIRAVVRPSTKSKPGSACAAKTSTIRSIGCSDFVSGDSACSPTVRATSSPVHSSSVRRVNSTSTERQPDERGERQPELPREELPHRRRGYEPEVTVWTRRDAGPPRASTPGLSGEAGGDGRRGAGGGLADLRRAPRRCGSAPTNSAS